MVSLFSIFNLRLSRNRNLSMFISFIEKFISFATRKQERCCILFHLFIYFSNANAEIPHSFSDVVQHNILLGSEKRRSMLLCYKIRSQDKEM